MKKNMKKNMLWMLLSLMAAAIMMPLSATAQTRIAVVSDIHVMAPSLLPAGAENTTAWTSYYSGQRKMLQQSADLFDQFVETMSTEKPDILLITGDLTKDGELVSHKYVRGLQDDLQDENGKNEDSGLKKLEAAGIQVYVIPGNHDFGAEGNHTQFKADGTTENAPVLSTAGFASFYTGYGYGIDNDNNFVQDPNGSLSYVAEIADGLYLLAIDSHNGSVNDATLTWICDQAQVIRGAGKRVIAMMHHPLFPHITGAEFFATSYTVANYTTVRNALIAAGVNVILTGHFHTSDIAYDWKDNQTNGIYDINTGSLISYPCDYRILELSADKSKLSVQTNRLNPSGSDTWLRGRIKTIAINQTKNKIIGKFGQWAGSLAIKEMSNDIEALGDFAANLFMLHADGNEPQSTQNVTYESIYTQAQNYDYLASSLGYDINFTNMTHSILEDRSNYGNDHANQTDDRELTEGNRITLTPSGTLNSILNLLDNEDNRTVINLYDGEENVTVTLSGRTLYKDGAWNTICLPFSLTAEQISTYLSPEADIRALSADIVYDGKTTGFDNDNNTLILNFTPKAPAAGSVTTIEAGRPYIIKWDNTNNTNETITNPVFTGVTIDKTPHDNGNANVVTFCGTYAWQKFTDDNTSILLIGKNNSNESVLYYPKPALTNPNQVFNAETNPWIYPSLGACRAYFQLAKGYTAGDLDNPSPGGGGIRNFVLNFGDDDSATGIIAIGDSQLSTLNAQRSEWFTLDGRRLAAKPTAKGLYIHAGRKVVIK